MRSEAQRTMEFTLCLFIALFSCSSAVPRKCRCNNNVCKAGFQFRSNFQTANQLCHDMGGQLITVPSKAMNDELKDLLEKLNGDFWIGLRLPYGKCTDGTSPLKGYRWTSDLQTTQFTNWRGNKTVCSSGCVSVSVDLKWTEQLCINQSDGFLCENVPEHKCSSFIMEKRQSIVYHHQLGCGSGICEHLCNWISGDSFRCSCFSGFLINNKDQRRCVLNSCFSERCDPVCVDKTTSCECQDGYILHEENAASICEDINECENNNCDHFCYNTLGSYECSCQNGFRLVDGDKCVKINVDSNEIDSIGWTTHRPSILFTPSLNYTRHASVGSPGKFIGVIVFIVVGIVGVIIFVRYWNQKTDEPSTSLTSKGDDVQANV